MATRVEPAYDHENSLRSRDSVLDSGHLLCYMANHLAHRGAPPGRQTQEAEQARFPRADLQPAPGRLRASVSPALRPVREVLSLDWDRNGRVTPASTESQETWPGVAPPGKACGECRGGAPEGERAPTFGALPRADGLRRLRKLVCDARTLVGCAFRRSASLGFFCGGGKSSWWLGKTRTRDAPREGFSLSAPARSVGQGDHTKCGGGGVRRGG